MVSISSCGVNIAFEMTVYTILSAALFKQMMKDKNVITCTVTALVAVTVHAMQQ